MSKVNEINLQVSQSHWAPDFIKEQVPEFLDYIVGMVEANKPFLPLIRSDKSKPSFYLIAPEVGGSSVLLGKELHKEFPENQINIITDNLPEARLQHFKQLFPDINVWGNFTRLSDVSKGEDGASKVAVSINHAHLLSDGELVSQLKRMTQDFDQIVIGEGNNKSIRQVIGMLLLSPLVACVCGPLVKPFKWSRLFFTYVIPLIPFTIAWDGMVALFKIRSPESIKALVEGEGQLQSEWTWESGKLPNNRGGFIIYLRGVRK